MDLLKWTLLRFYGYGFLFGMFFMRGPIPNPFFTFFLQKTRLNIWVTASRLCMDWKIFINMSEQFVDYRIQVNYKDGNEASYWLRRDSNIGPVRLHSDLTRLCLSFYFSNWPFLPESLLKRFHREAEIKNRPIQKFQIMRSVFSSFEQDEKLAARSAPLSSDVVFNWSASS